MLKGIHPLLGPDLLHAIRTMGHGDDIVIADANFPSSFLGPKVIRADGVDAAAITLKALRILGSMSGDIGDYHTALALLDRFQHRFDWDRLIGTQYRLDQLDQAMNSMLAAEQIKPVLRPNLT